MDLNLNLLIEDETLDCASSVTPQSPGLHTPSPPFLPFGPIKSPPAPPPETPETEPLRNPLK